MYLLFCGQSDILEMLLESVDNILGNKPNPVYLGKFGTCILYNLP